MSQPSLVVSLAPDGTLVAEHFTNGGRHSTPLKPGFAEADIRRILQAKLRSLVALGEDGQPTAHQVRHWERHEVWKDPSCPFCIAEGLRPQKKRKSTNWEEIGSGGAARVRTLPPGSAKKLAAQARRQAAPATAEELGL